MMVVVKLLLKITLVTIIALTASAIKPKQTQECCEEYCYVADSSLPFRPQYKNLGQRNSYDFIKGWDYQIYNMPGCQAEKLWTLVRHGTRYPSPESMLELKELDYLRDEVVRLYNESSSLPQRGKLCNDDLQLITNWSWDQNITGQYDEFLTISGWNEMRDLAIVYKSVFPDLIGNAYSPETFLFRHTDFQRTEGSYKAFVEGLFGEGAYNNFTIDPPQKPSMLLNPHELCNAFKENILVQDGPNTEMTKFRETEMFQKLRRDVSMRIGFATPPLQPLSDKIILNIYEMCRFDKAWFPEKPSAWCAALTQSQIKILEYHEELELHMKTSYGFNINTRLGCTAMADMVNHLSSDTSRKVIAYFAHIDNIHPHLTAMGAFKDSVPIRHDNFEATANNRKWITSEICPFSSNVAAVKYHCPNDVEEKDKVKFFLNQKILHLDWCDNNGICKLSDVIKEYSLFKDDDCDQIFCSESNSNRLGSKFILIFISTVTVISYKFVLNFVF